MKRFDPEAIENRLLQRLQVHENWATILNVGTIGNLIKTISEGNAELARYLEYLYLEKKWETARNISSLTSMGDLIGYKRELPKSAIGFVIVSHNDANGVNRLENYGNLFFDLDQSSDWDDLYEKTTATTIEKSALVPWMADESYVIPKGTIFKSANGISFISTEDVESRPLKEPWSSIKNNEDKLNDFYLAGGWNGIKYLKVPVIQGEVVKLTFGIAKGTKFESFIIDSLSVENASNTISTNFFTVTVIPIINGIEQTPETWVKVNNIKLAGQYDKVFETKILNDSNSVLIKFGDGITGQLLPQGAKIKCSYLDTDGEDGNIEKLYQITSFQFPNGYTLIDPRTNEQSMFLSCTNIVPISGGKNLENETDYRLNAPPSYLKNYSVATIENYLSQILNNSPVNLLHCKLFSSNVLESNYFGTSNSKIVSTIENSVLTEINQNKSALVISAIKSNGTLFDDPETELIEPLILSLADRKSPNDSFEFLQPNLIELRPNIVINTNDTMLESDIKNEILPLILAKYSIFSTDFEKPYYKSDIIEICQKQYFTKFVECFIEAKEPITTAPTIVSTLDSIEAINPSGTGITSSNPNNWTLLDYTFQFDKIFAVNKINSGFRNYKNSAPYLIRLDILFKSNPENDMSFFLFDNRVLINQEISLLDSEDLKFNENVGLPNVNILNFQSGNIVFFDEYSPLFYNRQVRTAQFNYITKITTDSYCNKMKLFNVEPYEIRPLLVDENGNNKEYSVNDVPEDERLSLNFDSNISGNICYWKNSQYFFNTKIEFEENYDDYESDNYAKGHFILPLKYITDITTLQQLYDMNIQETDMTIVAENLQKIIKENVTITAYAQPLIEKFSTLNPIDIIYSNEDTILCQKNFILN